MVEVIPVIDIMNGLVVRAIAGQRDRYKPLDNSVIVRSPRPEDALAGFKKLGCGRLYIADLDAILGRGDNSFVIDMALGYGFRVLADVGRRGLSKADEENVSYVIGTEYIDYPDELAELSGRAISMDTVDGMVLFRNTRLDPERASAELCRYNPSILIVLNLSRVGTEQGLDFDLLRIARMCCKTELAVGGGIRSVDELKLLNTFGVRYVLVATAIHKGLVDRCIY
uniref:HisA/HisF family protein n=1 Tax=Ignisphaera aggregans TaxID=334771 RepID=A0A7C2VDR5_9CREN